MAFTRREFIEAAGGLVIGFSLPHKVRPYLADAATEAAPTMVTAFLRVGTDDSVTILLNHSEMGQGVWTGLPMLIAEELDADWSKVRVEHAPAAPEYAGPSGRQGTGGSRSTRSEFDRLRKVGATARSMLVEAAARRWKTDGASLRTENGFVLRGGEKLSYGQLAADAGKLPQPGEVKLKDPADWKIIGTPRLRLDTPEKITGRAKFGMDVQFPGLLTAVVLRSPTFGGKLKSFKADAAMKVPGVTKVVEVPSGVAVVAEHFWAAQSGREAVEAEWDPGEGGDFDSNVYLAKLRELSKQRGPIVAADAGDLKAAFGRAAHHVEATYEAPYLAHASMEPLNATVRITGKRCEIWSGTQSQTSDQAAAAEILGIKPEDVTLHTMFLGGGFGRRASSNQDFVREAVEVARAAGAPVKTVWTREDDLRGGHYRPMYVHHIEGAVDGAGHAIAWRHTIAGQPIPRGGRTDSSGYEGVADSPYLKSIAAHEVTMHSPPTPVTVQWWRSVGNTHTAFAMESFIDELAHAARRNPLDFRRDLLKDAPQHLRVLEAAASKAGWGGKLPAGQGRGLAVHASFGSVVAQVADVSVEKGKIRVHRVVCAIDCGTAVNPSGVIAQMQSGIVYGLSAALHGAIHLKKGRVEEGNFDDYPIVRMPEAPKIDVVIVPSKAEMGGAGEPGTPPIAPAVANAVFALTGKRPRAMPFVV